MKDAAVWSDHWDRFLKRLKFDTGLDDSEEINEAVRVYQRVTLDKQGGPEGVDAFIQQYMGLVLACLSTA